MGEITLKKKFDEINNQIFVRPRCRGAKNDRGARGLKLHPSQEKSETTLGNNTT